MRLPAAGDTFQAKYRIDALLGEGGFGRVYRATTLQTSRQVAIKVLKPSAEGYDVTLARRFLREVRAVAGLEHPNTITLFDWGRTDDGLLFMVSEFVEGTDLSELLVRDERFTDRECLGVILQVLASLREAHAAGILHRDIKPANIRLSRYEGRRRVHVLDFGIAKSFLDEQDALTATGRRIGTPRYMSPEHLLGDPLTPAADVYSVGLVAYEMLLGADSISPRDRLNRLRESDLDPALIDVLGQMIEPEVSRRFTSAQQAIDALRAVRAGTWVPSDAVAQPPPPPERQAQPRPMPGRRVTAQPTTVDDPDAGDSSPSVGRIAIVVIALVVMVGAIVLSATREEAPPVAEAPAQVSGLVAAPEPPTPVLDVGPPDVSTVDLGPLPPGPGCGEPPPFVGPGELSTIDGLHKERWSAYIPTSYSPREALPLVVVVGPQVGESGLVDPKEALAGFHGAAERDRYIAILVPHSTGTLTSLGAQSDRRERALERIDDIVAYTSQMLCIDETRVAAVATNTLLGDDLVCRPWLTTGMVLGATRHISKDVPALPCPERLVPLMLVDRSFSMRRFFTSCELGEPCAAERRFQRGSRQLALQRNDCDGPAQVVLRHAGATCVSWSCGVGVFDCYGGHEAEKVSKWKTVYHKLDFPLADATSAFLHLEGGLLSEPVDGDAGTASTDMSDARIP